MNYNNFLSEDSSKIIIQKEFALMLIGVYQQWNEGGAKFHRTPVNEIKGDALDAVELEMVNDQIVDKVEKEFSTENYEVIDKLLGIISSPDEVAVLDAHDQDLVNGLIRISNTVYMQLSKDKMENFTIGEGQEKESPEFSNIEENPKELLRYLLMIFMEELVSVW